MTQRERGDGGKNTTLKNIYNSTFFTHNKYNTELDHQLCTYIDQVSGFTVYKIFSSYEALGS